MVTSNNIEKLFLEYLKDVGETPGGFMGILNLELLEEGDPKALGNEIQRGADILEMQIQSMHFQPWELEEGKAGSRLKKALKVYREIGKEISQMTEREPQEYHFYVIAILIDMLSSSFNHIEAHINENE